jgi:hypothetical protein
MTKLAENTGVSYLIVEHALKRISPKAHPLTAMAGGSSGLPAATRMGFVYGIDPNDADRRILACVKHNVRSKPKPLAFEMDADELELDDGKITEIPSLVVRGEMEGFDAMRLANAPGPVLAKDVVEDGLHHKFSKRTLRRAADDMAVVRTPPGGGPKCTWELNAEVKQALAQMDDDEDGGGDGDE